MSTAVLLSIVLGSAGPTVAPNAAPSSAAPRIDVPAFTGTAALVAGGALHVASVGLHAASFELMRDTCGLEEGDLATAKFDGDTPKQAEREIVKVGGLGIACLAVADQAIRLRVGAGLAALGGLSLVSTGALLMGRSDAFHDLVVRDRDRRGKAWALGVAGATLLGAATATWLGTRLAMATHRSGCGTIDCYTRFDIVSFQVAAAVGSAGAGMLSWGASYQRRIRLLQGVPRAQWSFMPGRSAAMVAMSGRF